MIQVELLFVGTKAFLLTTADFRMQSFLGAMDHWPIVNLEEPFWILLLVLSLSFNLEILDFWITLVLQE